MPEQSPRSRAQGPQTQRKRPGDLTGVQGQKLAAERDERQAAELAAQAAAKQEERVERLTTVVDLTPDGRFREEVEEIAVAAEPHPETMLIRVNYPIENMTYGKTFKPAVVDDEGRVIEPPVMGNLVRYDFEEGQQYRVPWDVGMHLKGLGYVYDF